MGKPQQLSKLRLVQTLVNHQDALVCLFNQGVVSVAGFATSVLIGRLAPSELGVYYIGLSLVLFARGFQQQLVSTPYAIYLHRQEEENLPAYRGSCLVQEFGFLIIASAYLFIQVLAVYAGWFSDDSAGQPSDVLPSLIVLLVFMPVLLMRELVRHYCFAHSENTSVLGIDLAISVLQIVALLCFGYFEILSGATVWVAIGIACVLSIGFWYFRYGPKIKLVRKRLKPDLKQNWSFGKWAVSGQFVGSLPNYLLPMLLLMAVGAEGTGFFAACITLVGVANIFNTGMLNFLTPRAAKVYVTEGKSGLKRLLLRMYGVFLVAVGGFAILLTIFGSYLSVKLFGPNYHGLQTVMILLAIAKLFEGFSHTASGGLFAMEKIKANFGADVILMLVTISAALLLIKPYGVEGAAWTTLIGAVVGSGLRSGLLIKFLNEEPIPNELPVSGGENV